MNKYQEALYIINERFDYINEELHPNKHYLKPQFSLDTLQELIDNYSKISQFDRVVFFNANGLCVNGITYEQLEKALDKSCVIIMRILNCLKTNDCKFCPLDRCVQNDIEDNWENSNDIKKYLLKESEK